MKFKVLIMFVFVMVIGTCIAYATTVIPNRPCLTCPAGSTQGGADCASKSCYYISGNDPHYRQHFAYSYTKCGTTEYYLPCTASDAAYPYGHSHCATAKRYANSVDCTANANGSISQTFYTTGKSCT